MSEGQRRRLATAAADAGYPGELLAAIAHATLPGYTPGQRLGDRGLVQVADAVELLAEAGLTAEQTGALLSACRARAGESWRQQFWGAGRQGGQPERAARPRQRGLKRAPRTRR